MFYFLGTVNFGRGKDKKLRKRPSVKQGFITGAKVGAGLGAGFGLLGTAGLTAIAPKGQRRKALRLGLLGTVGNTGSTAVKGSLIGGGVNYLRKRNYDREN